MHILKSLCFSLLTCVSVAGVSAQTLPVGLMAHMDDDVRRQQLLGKDSLKHSFAVRPMQYGQADSLGRGSLLWAGARHKLKLYALPAVWQQQFNSHHPYGINDGAMIPSKGYEMLVSTGVYFEAGPLSVQLRPEYVWAQNAQYPVLTDYNQPQSLLNNYYSYRSGIDLPDRFGDGSYSRLNWGQSAVRLSLGAAALSFSTENLWWGPGRYNALLMTNSAAGFKHFSLATSRPANTPIGTFEAQLIAGRLDNSEQPEPAGAKYAAKRSDWRYINGLVFTYQPKWVPGLYLGFDRSFILYHNDRGKGFTDYFPVFTFLTKAAFADDSYHNTEDAKRRDQRISLFARWVWPESHSEIYFQWGREDHSWNGRDVFLEPEHTRAYIVGFNKLVPLARPHEYIQVGMEFTQMESSNSNHVRAVSSWYTHSQIRQGYTHEGQFLGAGNGPDNMQIVDVAWVKGLNRIGLKIERQVHNNDLYIKAFEPTMDSRKHWVDLGFIAQGNRQVGPWIFNAQLGLIQSFNYQYYLPEPPAGEYWYGPKNDVMNLNLRLGICYRW